MIASKVPFYISKSANHSMRRLQHFDIPLDLDIFANIGNATESQINEYLDEYYDSLYGDKSAHVYKFQSNPEVIESNDRPLESSSNAAIFFGKGVNLIFPFNDKKYFYDELLSKNGSMDENYLINPIIEFTREINIRKSNK